MSHKGSSGSTSSQKLVILTLSKSSDESRVGMGVISPCFVQVSNEPKSIYRKGDIFQTLITS